MPSSVHMYALSPTPKKTVAGLPIRNIDYGSLHKSLRVSEKDDVKRKLEPDFLHSLGNMCLKASVKGDKSGGKTDGYHGNTISCQDKDRIKRNTVIDPAYSYTLNNHERSPSPYSCKLHIAVSCICICVFYLNTFICNLYLTKHAVNAINVF